KNPSGISMSRIDRIYVNEETLKFTQQWQIRESGKISDHRMVSVEIIKKGLPYIGKGLWKLQPDMIDYTPFTNRTRKLLLETIKEEKKLIEKGEKISNLWTRRKNTIQKIGMEETTQRKRGMEGNRFLKNRELQKALKRTNGELCKGYKAA